MKRLSKHIEAEILTPAGIEWWDSQERYYRHRIDESDEISEYEIAGLLLEKLMEHIDITYMFQDPDHDEYTIYAKDRGAYDPKHYDTSDKDFPTAVFILAEKVFPEKGESNE